MSNPISDSNRFWAVIAVLGLSVVILGVAVTLLALRLEKSDRALASWADYWTQRVKAEQVTFDRHATKAKAQPGQ